MNRMYQRCTRSAAAAVLTAAVFGAQAPAASAQSDSSNVVLNQGTVIPVKLNTELTSNRSQRGDPFSVTVDNSKSSYRQILNGATLDGVVRNASPQNAGNPGTLEVAFTRLHLSSGSSYNISGSATSLDPKFVTTRADGVLQAKNTNKDEHLTYAGYGAGAGLLVSILANGGVKVKDSLLDAAIGGVLGYVTGSVLKGPTQVHDVDLKPGTELGVLLNNDVTYNNPQSGAYGQQNGYHQTYVSQGNKYYWYQDQKWAMNLATGQRRPASLAPADPAYRASNYKFYTYQGSSYVLNRDTGERTLLH